MDTPNLSNQNNQPNQALISPESPKKQKSTRRNIVIAVLAAIVIVAVAWAVIASRAATPRVAVLAPQAVANARAFTGGNDIAIVWDVDTTIKDIRSYNVYRDGRLLGRVTPSSDKTYLTGYGNRYHDSTVQAGKTYTYQVSTTNTKGQSSGLSRPVWATHPTNSAPLPTITIDASAATDLAATLEKAKTTLLSWYPKIASVLAWPDYTPQTNFTLKVDPNYSGTAYRSGNTIGVSTSYLRGHQNDMGMFIHEATHILQNYPSYSPRMIVEGIPDWVREYVYADRKPTVPGANATYNDGYGTSAYFLQWLRKTYDAKIIRSLNVTAHNGGSYAAVLSGATSGKTVGQLWTKMTGRNVSSLGPVTGIGGRCLDLLNYSTTNGNTVQLINCVKNGAQDWLKMTEPSSSKSGAFSLRVLGKCLDVKHSGKMAGTPVWIWDCNGSAAQQWVAQSNGTLLNVNSGMCLQTKGGASTNGVTLEIAACNGTTAAQKWGLPPA